MRACASFSLPEKHDMDLKAGYASCGGRRGGGKGREGERVITPSGGEGFLDLRKGIGRGRLSQVRKKKLP